MFNHLIQRDPGIAILRANVFQKINEIVKDIDVVHADNTCDIKFVSVEDAAKELLTLKLP